MKCTDSLTYYKFLSNINYQIEGTYPWSIYIHYPEKFYWCIKFPLYVYLTYLNSLILIDKVNSDGSRDIFDSATPVHFTQGYTIFPTYSLYNAIYFLHNIYDSLYAGVDYLTVYKLIVLKDKNFNILDISPNNLCGLECW